MTRTICLIFVLVLSACAAGNKSAKPPEAPTAQVPTTAPTQYQIADPGQGWETRRNVLLRPDMPPAKMFLRHQTGGKMDGVIVIMALLSAADGPKQHADSSKVADEKIGSVASEVACTKEKPPLRCEYKAIIQGPAGQMSGKVVFRYIAKTRETVAFTGFWPVDAEAAMLGTFETIVDSLSI